MTRYVLAGVALAVVALLIVSLAAALGLCLAL